MTKHKFFPVELDLKSNQESFWLPHKHFSIIVPVGISTLTGQYCGRQCQVLDKATDASSLQISFNTMKASSQVENFLISLKLFLYLPI